MHTPPSSPSFAPPPPPQLPAFGFKVRCMTATRSKSVRSRGEKGVLGGASMTSFRTKAKRNETVLLKIFFYYRFSVLLGRLIRFCHFGPRPNNLHFRHFVTFVEIPGLLLDPHRGTTISGGDGSECCLSNTGRLGDGCKMLHCLRIHVGCCELEHGVNERFSCF